MAEEEEPSAAAVGIAGTLLGAVAFFMSIMYLTNHSDKDMRKYSYRVINETVSIFCAVMLFQSFDDIVEILMEEVPESYRWAFDMLHMLCWYFIMQVVLAYKAGMLSSSKSSKSEGHAEGSREKEREAERKKAEDTHVFTVLLAHLTGFAAINSWGALQQLDMFSKTPFRAFMVVPLAAFCSLLLLRATDWVRERMIVREDEKKDGKQVSVGGSLWDEQCEDAENDVVCLTLSFSLTQVLRYWLCDHLPDPHGKEPMEVLRAASFPQVMTLWTASVSSAVLMCGLYKVGALMKPEEEGGEEKEHREGSDAGEGSGSEEEEAVDSSTWDWPYIRARFQLIVQQSLAMSFAWLMFYSTRTNLARFSMFHDSMVLSVSVAVAVSFSSIACIRLLDKTEDYLRGANCLCNLRCGDFFLVVDDKGDGQQAVRLGRNSREKSVFNVKDFKTSEGRRYVKFFTSDRLVLLTDGSVCRALPDERQRNSRFLKMTGLQEYDCVEIQFAGEQQRLDIVHQETSQTRQASFMLEHLIAALGILVGFSWEQCFDEAVEALADFLPEPHVSKLLLGMLCVLVLVPAWKWYILPMSYANGWKYGFVLDHEDMKWHDVVQTLYREWDRSVRAKAQRGSIIDEVTEHKRALITDAKVLSERIRSWSQAQKEHRDSSSDSDEGTPAARPPRPPGPQRHSPPSQPSPPSPRELYLGLDGEEVPELAELRAMNLHLQETADRYGRAYHKLRSEADRDHRAVLRTYNQQMDMMLQRMKQLHSQVFSARGSPVYLPEPRPRGEYVPPAHPP